MSPQVFILVLTTLLFRSYISQTPSPTIPYDGTDCSVIFPTKNAEFNLCHLTLGTISGSKQYYPIKDARYEDNHESTYYEYYFNIGGPMSIFPDVCVNITHHENGFLNQTDDDHLTHIGNPWAVQVRYDLNITSNEWYPVECWHLSNDVGGPPQWSLIHNEDPTEGVTLEYLHGDHSLVCNTNRKFVMNFQCENNIDFLPEEEVLHEYNLCEYTMTIPSSEGCPIECRRYNYEVCGGEGLCGFDFSNDMPRCFCYYKYHGDDCSIRNDNDTMPDPSNRPPPPHSPYVLDFKSELTGSVDVLYDLSSYAIDGGAYVIHEQIDKTFVYYVGIPNPLIPDDGNNNGGIVPSYCNDAVGPCQNINTTSGECMDDNIGIIGDIGYSFVFQVDFINKTCFALGTQITPTLYDLYDDPARGVTIIYSDGSWCQSEGKNREFRINLICPMDQDGVYDPRNETDITQYFVEEDDLHQCTYSFTMESAIACPYQCRTNKIDTNNKELFTVCSQHGICAADPNAGFVRCLCDYGYDGYFGCDDTQEPTKSPTISPTNNPTEYPTRSPSNEPTKAPTNAPSAPPTQSPITNTTAAFIIVSDVIIEEEPANTSYVVSIIILVVVLVIFIILGYLCYKKMKLKYNVLKLKVDDLQYNKFTGDDQQDITIDNKGKTQYSTIHNSALTIDDAEEQVDDDA